MNINKNMLQQVRLGFRFEFSFLDIFFLQDDLEKIQNKAK